MKITVYSDGACIPNPGKGAWAAVILQDQCELVTLSGVEEKSTNNRMEIYGIIAALESLPKTPHLVTLHSDSMYVVNSINKWMTNWESKGWQHKVKREGMQPVKNKDLWVRLAALRKVHKLRAEWVKGHNGDHWNEYCDRIANGLVSAGVDVPFVGIRKPKAVRLSAYEKEIDKLSEELVNNLVRLDMTYCFTSEEHDEMLRRIEALHNAAMK